MTSADKYAEIKQMRLKRDKANTREFYCKLLDWQRNKGNPYKKASNKKLTFSYKIK